MVDGFGECIIIIALVCLVIGVCLSRKEEREPVQDHLLANFTCKQTRELRALRREVRAQLARHAQAAPLLREAEAIAEEAWRRQQ